MFYGNNEFGTSGSIKSQRFLCTHVFWWTQKLKLFDGPLMIFRVHQTQGLLDLDGRNSQKYFHQTWAYF